MKFVVKIGGAALENPALLQKVAHSIAELAKDGHKVALVHGGGVQLTRLLKQMGKTSEFVAGLRITDAETRDAALMVLGGRVNKSLVAALTQCGQSAMGLTGGDGHVFRARKKKTNPDLGFQLSPDGKRLIIISSLDNLLKGASSQAGQTMNLMAGWHESEGLL